MAAVTEKDVEEFVIKLMKEDPTKFVQYALPAIAGNLYKANVGTFSFSQESSIDDKRFKTSISGTIQEIK